MTERVFERGRAARSPGHWCADELPDPSAWDPSPEDEAALRDRLLRAGEERAGGPAPVAG